MACTAATMRAITTGEALQGKQIKSFPSKGVTAAKLPDDVINELKRVTDEVMKEEAAKDKDFAKIWASQTAFHDDYQVWKEMGYLPRNFK
jgi:TRAP-type mannitol/chloroaromatic compound transport system substrate-binding protein